MERTNTGGPRRRWTDAGTGDWYEGDRWSHAKRRARDPALVARILDGRLSSRTARVLDAPCGTGRLHDAIAAHGTYVGLEIAAPMLETARSSGAERLARGDVERMPFRASSFEAVVCCRLLHHLRGSAELERTLAELVRVSDAWIVGSFWDSASLEALRHRVPFVRRPRHRIAHPKARIEAALRRAGATVVEWKHSLRFLSQQAWFVARKTDAARDA